MATTRVLGGIETGGTWTVCAVGTGPDDVRAEVELPTRTPGETVDGIVSFFEALEPDVRPAAIGLGAFGPLDLDPASERYGTVTTTPKPGWRDTPLLAMLRNRLDLPIAIDTDVGAAALAEARWGAGRGAPTVAYLTVGTGIGAGLVVGGRIWRPGLSHPEVGHLRVPHHPDDEFTGTCPLHGDCWEGLAAGPAIEARWGSPGAELPADHPAWKLQAHYLALGILAIVSVAAPHRVVVGGGVGGADGLLERVRVMLAELNAGYLPLPELVAPALGDRAGVLGGFVLAETAVRG